MKSRLLKIGRICDRQLTSAFAANCSHSRPRWSSTSSGATRQWSTPLAKILGEAITTTGPIPVATYMRQCLTSDLGGYYTGATPDRDQFGQKGDFVTSPEISQVFGELLGLWVVAEWIAQGRRSKGVCLMELGPGRGTLMDDMLRTIRNFKDLVAAMDSIYLVEASASLRSAQHKLLCSDSPLEKTDIGYESRCKYDSKLKVVWVEDIRLLSKDPSQTPFMIAHEFFDALPIHVFQSVPPNPSTTSEETIQTPTGPIPAKNLPRTALEHQWREMLISPSAPSSSPSDSNPEFELTLSKASTPHSLYLPEKSPRYTSLKPSTDAVIEISPEAQIFAADLATRIGPSGGAALVVDYGPPTSVPANSLRGIARHRIVSPFARAGETDLSADVDFGALAEAALEASPDVEVHGPVSQAAFLGAMGIESRVAQLVKRAMDRARTGGEGKEGEKLSETVGRIESGWRRLVDRGEQGMGKLYQFMAIVPHRPEKGTRRPVGFGGDIKI